MRRGTVVIVGVGLIGGSVGLAVRARGLAGRVVGIDRDRDRLEQAIRLGIIDDAADSIEAGVGDAEIVVVATPPARTAEVCIQAAGNSPEDVLITDAASTKYAIVADVERDISSRSRFVGAHPIAGSEKSGAEFARADLFQGHACVLTPTDATPRDRVEHAATFWSGIGCRVVTMSPSEHDNALARTSHLPHAVASALAGCVPPEILPLAGGAYRDGTRVAASDPGLWSEIFLENRAPVLDALHAFDLRFARLRLALEAGDSAEIQKWWSEARSLRREFDAPCLAR